MSKIYEESKDEDGFLYVTYSGENTCDRFPRSVSDDHVLFLQTACCVAHAIMPWALRLLGPCPPRASLAV